MRKILLSIVLLLLLIILAGCGIKPNDMLTASDRFVVVSRNCGGPDTPYVETILRDKETGVLYLLIECSYRAGITPLLNADGTPIVLEESA